MWTTGAKKKALNRPKGAAGEGLGSSDCGRTWESLGMWMPPKTADEASRSLVDRLRAISDMPCVYIVLEPYSPKDPYFFDQIGACDVATTLTRHIQLAVVDAARGTTDLLRPTQAYMRRVSQRWCKRSAPNMNVYLPQVGG